MNLSQLYYFAKLSEMQHYANAAQRALHHPAFAFSRY